MIPHIVSGYDKILPMSTETQPVNEGVHEIQEEKVEEISEFEYVRTLTNVRGGAIERRKALQNEFDAVGHQLGSLLPSPRYYETDDDAYMIFEDEMDAFLQQVIDSPEGEVKPIGVLRYMEIICDKMGALQETIEDVDRLLGELARAKDDSGVRINFVRSSIKSDRMEVKRKKAMGFPALNLP